MDCSLWNAEERVKIEYNCTVDMFNTLIDTVSKAGFIPVNISHCEPDYNRSYIPTSKFRIVHNLDLVEDGICIDFGVQLYEFVESQSFFRLGDIKCPDISRVSYEKMGKFLGNFMHYANEYKKVHKQEFDKFGYQLNGIFADGNCTSAVVYADTYDNALKKMEHFFNKNDNRLEENKIVLVKLYDKSNNTSEIFDSVPEPARSRLGRGR